MNTIQRLLYESMRAHADRRAIVDSGSRNSLTYSELYDRASSVAGYLRSQGMDTGDYAVIALTKSVPYIIVEAACFLFGFGARRGVDGAVREKSARRRDEGRCVCEN